MNIYSDFVYKKAKVIVLLFSLIISLNACRSIESSGSTETAADSEFYTSRPKIILETPVARLPYTLRWEGSKSVRSYEIQSALDPEFTASRQNWTTKESFLVINELKDETVYFRVRSRFDSDFSRWSEVLQITRSGDEIRLNRLRS